MKICVNCNREFHSKMFPNTIICLLCRSNEVNKFAQECIAHYEEEVKNEMNEFEGTVESIEILQYTLTTEEIQSKFERAVDLSRRSRG